MKMALMNLMQMIIDHDNNNNNNNILMNKHIIIAYMNKKYKQNI